MYGGQDQSSIPKPSKKACYGNQIPIVWFRTAQPRHYQYRPLAFVRLVARKVSINCLLLHLSSFVAEKDEEGQFGCAQMNTTYKKVQLHPEVSTPEHAEAVRLSGQKRKMQCVFQKLQDPSREL